MTVEQAIDILELRGEEITPQVIRRAFIRLSKKYHPDATGKSDDKMFKLINEAYMVLRENPQYRNDLYNLSYDEIRLMLDNLILEIVEEFDKAIYIGIVIPELKKWFQGGDPLKNLKSEIDEEINKIKPHLHSLVEEKFDRFSQNIGAKLDGAFYHVTSSFDVNSLSKSISESITPVLGLITTAVIAMMSGGSGMALIATGPLGLLLGAGIGAWLFAKGKGDIQKSVENYITENGLPKIVKDFVADKVLNKIEEGEEKFVQELRKRLRQDLEPLYKKIKLIHGE
jgi:hypothetical protein